jgi:transcriptional regulator with XRE-family HTH domain
MNEHTNHQVITQNGKPAFAVIPWDEYQKLLQAQTDDSDIWFPNDVVKANVRGDSLIKAWREHFGLTQEALAEKAGIKQPALARLEKAESNPRNATLKKLADAMEISVEQLIDWFLILNFELTDFAGNTSAISSYRAWRLARIEMWDVGNSS